MPSETVLVTGGGGYVGSVLCRRLLQEGYRVKALDLFMFGADVFDDIGTPSLERHQGDVRDQALIEQLTRDCDSVIHLACISNDPSFELNPSLSRAINFEAFEPLVTVSKRSGVKRFVYASTSSVYGVSETPEVTEEHPLVPITDYNRYKAMCEPILFQHETADFTTVTIRPATVCGVSPRQRFDLTVNILTNHAVNSGRITVFGGSQQRPNIHIEDMVDLYVQLLQEPANRIAGKTFNAGYQNKTISEIAETVRSVVLDEFPDRAPIEVVAEPSDDIRSYHISSQKIARELGFVPKRTIEDAVRDLCRAFSKGGFRNSLTDSRYYNIRRMQELSLT